MPIETEWSGRDPDKDALRSGIWQKLMAYGAAVTDPVGHIPNFVGAEEAAARLAELSIWRQAQVLKCNPDSPQIPVRRRALEEGKLVYMAVPRLVDERCFVELDPAQLAARGVAPAEAAPWRGALQHGRLVAFEEMRPIDLVISGCVAVSRSGGRTGKGAGFADLELGMLTELGLLRPETPIVTTVHPLQIVDDAQLPMMAHDAALDWIVTPEEAIQTHTPHPRPRGLDWNAIRPEQYATIPVLRLLRARLMNQEEGM